MPTARTIAELLEYHGRVVIGLRELSRRYDKLTGADFELFPRTEEAFLEALEDMRDELDDEVLLALVASAERALRLDYAERLGDGSAPGIRFDALESKFGGRVRLEEILDVWKELAEAPEQAGHFKQIYKYRHGLAHGSWFNKSGLHDAAPDDADAVIREMFDAIRRFVGDFPRS